jgi:hypothetical protein
MHNQESLIYHHNNNDAPSLSKMILLLLYPYTQHFFTFKMTVLLFELNTQKEGHKP